MIVSHLIPSPIPDNVLAHVGSSVISLCKDPSAKAGIYCSSIGGITKRRQNIITSVLTLAGVENGQPFINRLRRHVDKLCDTICFAESYRWRPFQSICCGLGSNYYALAILTATRFNSD